MTDPTTTAIASPLERLFGRFTEVRAGEGRSIALFFSYALLMMVSYYILKTLREPLLLASGSAELKAYAAAVVALFLLFLVPLYSLVFRRIRKQQLTRWVTLFFLANLALFYAAGRSGLDIGFAYFVWVGIFSVMITAQFWAFAADSYNVDSGERIFPLVMVGATLGGLLAPFLTGRLYHVTGPWLLMMIAAGLLALTLPLVSRARAAVPAGSESTGAQVEERPHGRLLGGLALVFTDRYLLSLAVMILLLNWVNTTGEYILAELVIRHAEARVAADPALAKADLIASFYGSFFFVVNGLTLLVQVFAVARVMRRIGVGGSLLVLPLITLLGYGLVWVLPVFGLIRLVKVIENATDYSLMNTARHALYLPLPRAHTYEGKTAIEAFFWRFGDLMQAGVIFAGLHWFGFEVRHFALFNAALSLLWLLVALSLARQFSVRAAAVRAAAPDG